MTHAWYPVALSIGLAVICGLLVHLWPLRRLPLVRWMVFAFALAAAQTFALVAELACGSLAGKSGWMFVRFAFSPFMTIAWVAIALHIAGWWSRRWRLALIALLPLAAGCAACAAVPALHGLLRSEVALVQVQGWSYLSWQAGPWMPMHLLLCYGNMAAAIGILLLRARRPTATAPVSACLGSAALLLAPLLADVVFMLRGVTVVPGYNLAPVIYIATHAGFIALINRGHLLQFAPLAQRAAIAALPQPIFALDLSGEVADRNPAAAGLGGDLPPELRAPQPPSEWVWRQRTWSVSVAPVVVGGRALGRVILLSDVTDLRTALQRAEAADQAKARFLAVMSHELRTPLNSIVGYARLLEREAGDGRGREAVRAVSAAGAHLTRLVGDLFDLSRIEAGRHELHPDLVDPGEILRRAVEDHRPSAEARGLQLGLRLPPEPHGHRLLDPVRVTQVVGNLLRNAISHTVAGAVMVEAELHPDRLVVAVRDTGCGIPAADQPRLFRPFAQRVAERRSEGLGLGLTICHGWVTAMGGTITCASVEGTGSTFTVTIPCVPAIPKQVTPAAGTAVRRPLRVLVADDDSSCRRLLSAYLTDLGHEAVAVGDGAAAAQLLAQERFDAVLLDDRMPGRTGIEVASEVRSRAGVRPLLVAVTAESLAGDRERFLAAGFDRYLAKPVDLDQIDVLLAERSRRLQPPD